MTGVRCGSCGTDLRDDARFCDACGAANPAAPQAAQYKQVTVLFADVVGSMDIAATLEMERYRELMTTLLDHCATAVEHFGGTVESTGDGVMAIFGAPTALEDHAHRACLAALAIQEETTRLATDTQTRDQVTLRMRVGLNSGRVIAGDSGSGPLGYAATGRQVGMAQRMESAAPPGGIMLAESTALLVETTMTLADPEWVHIKGQVEPVQARQLVAIGARQGPAAPAETGLIGRRWEMSALQAMLDRAISGRGAIVNVVGPPGIGKSRAAREIAALATEHGVEVFWTFCESHAREIPFHAVTRLLRAGIGVADLTGEPARTAVHQQLPDVDPQDLLLLEDLLGIADPAAALPQIDPDARRRRLTALINTVTLARTQPALFLIEDTHWIDTVSEAMLTDFLTVIPRSPTMVLITSRPEYQGALTHAHGAQAIALAPLGDSDTALLLTDWLGTDPSVRALSSVIAERAAGNPFFAQEMVRELAQRDVLTGDRGDYRCTVDIAEVNVPATVQAAIEARIDGLTPPARRTLAAASVIGARFDTDLLTALHIDPVLDELLTTELIDQIRFTPTAEFTFHHPLIRTVAYESQLKTDRAELHQRLATAIRERTPGALDENAALIAEHLEAAGDPHAAYDWHMRAGTWAINRDVSAARLSWERARHIADQLPDDDPDRTTLRIAPRTMLCGIAWRVHGGMTGDDFDELGELCTAAGDKVSLAIGLAGQVIDHGFRGRLREASPLATEAWALIESIGDATLTVGLSFTVIYAKGHSGQFQDVLRWSERAIELADGDPALGSLLIGSPLAVALTSRAFGRYCLGLTGWADDLCDGLAMARSADPFSYTTVVAYVYFPGIPLGVLAVDDRVLSEIEDAARIAERSGDDMAVAFTRVVLGLALVDRPSDAERSRGQQVLADTGAALQREGHNQSEFRLMSLYGARELARRGNPDEAIPLMVAAIDELISEGQLLSWGIPATGILVETLLERRAGGDLAAAEAATARLADASTDGELVIRDIWLLRLRALLARSHGADGAYRDLVQRYRGMAESLGFQGHIAWAAAMASE